MQIWTLVILGTLVCSLGLLRRPKAIVDLMRPHFVVPGMIWMLVFAQAAQFEMLPPDWTTRYSDARDVSGAQALLYAIGCTLVFFLGYAARIGPAIARPLTSLDPGLTFNSTNLLHLGTAFGLFIALMMALLGGPAMFGVGEHWSIFGDESDIRARLGPAIIVIVGAGSAAVGMGIPSKGQRSVLAYLEAGVALFLLSLPYMASFSRGTGFPVLIAVITRILKNRRVNLVALVLAFAWVGMAGHAGLWGRGEHGHYAGVLPYLHFLVTESWLQWNIGGSTETVGYDAYTPLAVCFRAANTELGQLTVVQWLLFQVPIPRIELIHPEWTYTLTHYVGGYGTWGYTSGMLGDTYSHFHWWGVIPFFFVGVIYRMLDHLCFSTRLQEQNRVSFYMVVLFTGYYAIMIGLFNNFRSWTVAALFPLYGVIFLLLLRRIFMPGNPYEQNDGGMITYQDERLIR